MTDVAPPSISAVLPAFNEAQVVGDVARRTDAALRAAAVPAYEVVVVDDGSNDGTAAVVEAVARETPSVRVVRHDRNRGYGAALRTGFEAARFDAVWVMDADGQFDPADLPLLLSGWAPHTMVAGYREQRSDPLMRRLNHDVFFTLVRAVLGPVARDVNCAFKLFPRPLGVGLQADGAMISTELLLRARSEGCRIVEVAVPHHPRTTGSATGARPEVVLRAFGELWRMRRGRAPRTGPR